MIKTMKANLGQASKAEHQSRIQEYWLEFLGDDPGHSTVSESFSFPTYKTRGMSIYLSDP